MNSGAVAICGLLVLGGWAADVGPAIEQPSMYASMASPGAKVDAVAAASMISLYRQNNALGGVVVDPELMRPPPGTEAPRETPAGGDAQPQQARPRRHGAAGEAAQCLGIPGDAGGRECF